MWQHLSVGSHTGSDARAPSPHAPLAREGCPPSTRRPESLEAVSTLQGGPSPDQASVGTSPPSPEANYAPCQLPTSPGGPPQTLSLLMSIISPGTQEHFRSLNLSVICSVLFLSMMCHLIFWSWRKHNAPSSEASSLTQEDILLLNH